MADSAVVADSAVAVATAVVTAVGMEVAEAKAAVAVVLLPSSHHKLR